MEAQDYEKHLDEALTEWARIVGTQPRVIWPDSVRALTSRMRSIAHQAVADSSTDWALMFRGLAEAYERLVFARENFAAPVRLNVHGRRE